MSNIKKGENPHDIFWAKVREKEKERTVARKVTTDKMPGEEEIEIESTEQTGKMPGEEEIEIESTEQTGKMPGE